jgi:hypothetical protein
MIATQESVASTPPELQLPPNFESIEGLMDMPNERLKQGPFVNVIGLVKDYMPPIATKGSGMRGTIEVTISRITPFNKVTDFKCTLTIVDLSTEEQWGRGIKLMIFWPEEKMPRVSGPRDVVVLRNVKVLPNIHSSEATEADPARCKCGVASSLYLQTCGRTFMCFQPQRSLRGRQPS